MILSRRPCCYVPLPACLQVKDTGCLHSTQLLCALCEPVQITNLCNTDGALHRCSSQIIVQQSVAEPVARLCQHVSANLSILFEQKPASGQRPYVCDRGVLMPQTQQMLRSSKSRSTSEVGDVGVAKLGTSANPDNRDHICEAREVVIYQAHLVLHAECGQPYTARSGSHGQAHASCRCRGLPPGARPSVVDFSNPRGESLCLQPEPACVGSSSGSQAAAQVAKQLR